MAKLIGTVALLGLLMSVPVPARAHDAYDDSQSHPLRLAAYVIHPVGFALEWLVMRPIHFLVSQPKLEPVFGHTPHESPFGEYGPYEPARTVIGQDDGDPWTASEADPDDDW